VKDESTEVGRTDSKTGQKWSSSVANCYQGFASSSTGTVSSREHEISVNIGLPASDRLRANSFRASQPIH
jgi:hypothetical protein